MQIMFDVLHEAEFAAPPAAVKLPGNVLRTSIGRGVKGDFFKSWFQHVIRTHNIVVGSEKLFKGLERHVSGYTRGPEELAGGIRPPPIGGVSKRPGYAIIPGFRRTGDKVVGPLKSRKNGFEIHEYPLARPQDNQAAAILSIFPW